MLKKSFSLRKLHLTSALSFRKPDTFDRTVEEQFQKISEPFMYLQRVPSKHHRLMVPAFNHWLKVPKGKADVIEDISQSVHSATLLIDDIHDDSAFRYGVPATHRVFSLGLTLNAAYMELLLIGNKILELGHPLGLKIYLDRMIEMHHGQGIDLYWRDNFVCPTEDEHIDMIKKKAASFFIMLVEMLQLFSNREEDYTNLAMNVGMYYCILDDYLNLFNPKALESLANVKQGSHDHTSCSDITECKFTLPIIHAMQFPDIANELFDILKQRTTDPTLKKRFISLLKKHSSDKYTRETLNVLEADIRKEMNLLGGNTMLANLIDDLSCQKAQIK